MSPEVLKDRRCLVTGATRGLGKELAKALAMVGARVVVSGRDKAALEAIAREIKAPLVVADLADAAAVEELASAARSVYGGIDVLVNCAGVFPIAGIAEITLEEYELCFAVNVRAPFQLC